MKLITLLLSLTLAFTTALPAQSKKEGAKKAAAEAKEAAAEGKKEAKKAAAEAKGEAKKAVAKKGESKDLPPQNERCQAQTQDGDQCKRKAGAGSKFCWQHAAGQKKGEAKAKKKAA